MKRKKKNNLDLKCSIVVRTSTLNKSVK